MKILIIRNYPSYMAVKNNTYNIQEVGLAKALVRKGNVCDIVFWTDKEEEIVTIPVDDIGVVNVYYKRGKTILKNTVFKDCDALYAKYDILQPCEYNQIQSWILAKKYPEKVVIYHGPYYSKFNKRYNVMCKFFDIFLLKRYIDLNSKFIVKSDMAKSFLTSKGIREENVKTIGVGIDTQMLCTEQEENEEDIYLHMIENSDEVKFLYIGRFEERRDIPFIIRTFSEIKRKINKVRLYLIGTGEEKTLVAINKLIVELDLSESVVWQERVEQKYLSDIYKSADYFLLPTEYEIFGMVLLEAMYYKTVVISTPNGGANTLIKNGYNGIIMEYKDVNEWSRKIYDIHTSKSVELIKERANRTIVDKYTWDSLVESFLFQYMMLQ